MRRTPPEEKARHAFELMRSGIALERMSLRLQNPDASEAEIDALPHAWLVHGLDARERAGAGGTLAARLGKRFALVGGLAGVDPR